jgi:hypothetical protein
MVSIRKVYMWQDVVDSRKADWHVSSGSHWLTSSLLLLLHLPPIWLQAHKHPVQLSRTCISAAAYLCPGLHR